MATSISFGGKSAKSRYLCVSDEGGAASVWDMKKISRVRCFKMKGATSTSTSTSTTTSTSTSTSTSTAQHLRPSCAKSCMDPSDTHVVALHGDTHVHGDYSSLSSFNKTKSIALELFHLKTGTRVAMLKAQDFAHGGGADCFEFSCVDDNQLLVGARDGSLLLWDIAATSNGGGPFSVLEQRHTAAVMDVAFSPMNRVLAASCSLDGSVGFHDVQSKKTIQTIRPWDHPVSVSGQNINKSGGGGGGGGGGRDLTSIAFHHDGFTWAVGTEQGLVFTYDLRQTGAGPLCTMDVSGDADNNSMFNMNKNRYDPIKRLQFIQSRPLGDGAAAAAAVAPKSSAKKHITRDENGAVTVEREKLTPSTGRVEKSTTTYSVQQDEPSTSNSSATATSKPGSTGTRTVKRTTITTKKIISSSPQRAGSATLPTPPETKVERTSTSEFTTSSPQRPSTTRRITKNKVITSSPQRILAGSSPASMVSPPAVSSVAKDLFPPDTGSTKKEGSAFDKMGGASKKDVSVSFDERVVKRGGDPLDDLAFGDENLSASDASSDQEAEQMMDNFDKMFERINGRALKSDNVIEEDDDEDDDADDDNDEFIRVHNLLQPIHKDESEPAILPEPAIRRVTSPIATATGRDEMIILSKVSNAISSCRESESFTMF